MNEQLIRFGGDSEALRNEDVPLITGHGRFTDDVNLEGQAHACFVRSPHAHADVVTIDVSPALRMPGVLAVFTGAQLIEAGLGPIPMAMRFTGRDGKPMAEAPQPILAADRVRHVGEAVAMVVAETIAQAQDAAEQVIVELAELPVAASIETALEAPAPIWPDAPGNVALDWEDGDGQAVEAALARAEHVVSVCLADTRVAPTAMEPRAAIASWDEETKRLTLVAGTQGVALLRNVLAERVFKLPQDRLRVLTYDVGGGFGMKVQPYSEYAALLFAARQLRRPVKWRASRLESFLADTHGRDGLLQGTLALNSAGRFLALRLHSQVGIGAYTSTFLPVFSTNNTKNCLASVYTTPAIYIRVELVHTNTAPLGPYRGAGRPEAIYVLERLIDEAARRTGIDRVELRRRNLIPQSALPYRAPNGQSYDSGAFEAVMDEALALANWKGFPRRRAAAEEAGRLRGIGVCCFLEVAGGMLEESADLRFEAEGSVALRVGVQGIGQGLQTSLAHLVAGMLGVPADAVRVITGDSDEVPQGWPAVASRSLMMAGSAAFQACESAIEKGRRIAAHLMETAVGDVKFAEGAFRVVGTNLCMPILELAEQAQTASDLPSELAGGLDAVERFTSPAMSFPNGCHVCEVEIDPDTGAVAVVTYAAVDDVGVIVNRPIVEGQLHGGIVQGLGQVLGERLVYDTAGQLQTASFMDYAMPRADDVPQLRLQHHVVPCTSNPLGVKGSGESGVAGALPAAMNAVIDALAAAGIEGLDMPASPCRIWSALNSRT